MYELKVTGFFIGFSIGSGAPVGIILVAWKMGFRVCRLGWLVVLTAVVASVPIGLLILGLVSGPAPLPDSDMDDGLRSFVWRMLMSPAILLWAMAAIASMVVALLAWVARKLSG